MHLVRPEPSQETLHRFYFGPGQDATGEKAGEKGERVRKVNVKR